MRLDWPECQNVRDVGGLPTTGGPTIRSGALIRTDRLDRLTDEGVAALRGSGVSRIVDLRSLAELAEAPGPFATDSVYVHESFIDEDGGPMKEVTLVAIYRLSLIRNAHRIAACVGAVAEAPPGAVVVHCAAGKDRTGVLVGLVLEGLRARHERELLAETDPVRRERLRDLQSSRPDTILATFAHIEEKYGGTLEYLSAIGVPPHHIAALRERLVG